MANTYSTGTVAVVAGSKIVTLTGGLFISLNAKPGDQIVIDGDLTSANTIEVLTDGTHAELAAPWAGATVSGVPFVVTHMPIGWGDRVELAESVAENIRLIGTGIIAKANYATRAQLYADLQHPVDTLGRVYDDPNVAYKGVYKKLGGSGAGSWVRIGPLPEVDAVDAIAAEVTIVADNMASVTATGNDIDAVVTAAENIDAILAVPGIALQFGDVATAVEITDTNKDLTDADRIQTGIDAAATAANVVLAQTAAGAATVNANVYPDIATGRAAVADGGQFQVVVGTETVRYRRDSSTTQTEMARYPTAAKVNAISQVAVVGSSAPLTTTGSNVGSSTYVYEQKISSNGLLSAVNVFSAVAGTITMSIMNEIPAGTLVLFKSYQLTVAAGLNRFTASDFGFIPVSANQRLGFSGSGRIKYAAGSDLVYSVSASGGAMTSTTSTLKWSINFEVYTGEVSQLDIRLQQQNADVKGVFQYIGRGGGDTLVTGTGAPLTTYVLADPIPANVVVTGLRVFALSAGVIILKRWSKSGGDFTQIGDDISFGLVPGLNVFDKKVVGFIPINAGEFLGFYAPSVLAYVNSSSGTAYYRAASGGGNVSSFTGDTITSSVQFQLSIETKTGLESYVYQSSLSKAVASAVAQTQPYGDGITASVKATGLSVATDAVITREGVDLPLSATISLDAVTTSYARYDLLYFDADAFTLGVLKGTERIADPSAFIPAITNSKYKPVALLRVAAGAVVSVPLWSLDDGSVKSIIGQIELDRRRNRRLLPKTMAKIRKGSALRIVGFGDSITAIAQGTINSTVPNGQGRDRATNYLAGNYGSDVIAAVPLYTSVQLGRANDGAGQVHTRFGFNWELVATLEASGYVLGSTLFYDNFGIGGNDTSNAVASGAPTAWLSAAVALNADLAIIELGMNERGQPFTEANCIVIANAFKSVGTEVLFLGCPRPRVGTFSAWQYTHRALQRAADFTKSAFISMMPIFDDRYIQAVGMASSDLSTANANNHPGILEMKAIGLELSKTLLG